MTKIKITGRITKRHHAIIHQQNARWDFANYQHAMNRGFIDAAIKCQHMAAVQSFMARVHLFSLLSK